MLAGKKLSCSEVPALLVWYILAPIGWGCGHFVTTHVSFESLLTMLGQLLSVQMNDKISGLQPETLYFIITPQL